jgi:Flp pilus assembly protein TadG
MMRKSSNALRTLLRKSSSAIRALGSNRAGVTSIEFAATSVMFLFLIFAVLDLARYFVYQQFLQTLTNEVAHAALLDSTLTTDGNSVGFSDLPAGFSAATGIVPTGGLSQLQLNVYTTTMFGPSTLTVSSQYTFSAFSPLWASLDGPVTDTVTYTY